MNSTMTLMKTECRSESLASYATSIDCSTLTYFKIKAYLINIFKIRSAWNGEVGSQTIHPTEIFISMKLLQMSCMIT